MKVKGAGWKCCSIFNLEHKHTFHHSDVVDKNLHFVPKKYFFVQNANFCTENMDFYTHNTNLCTANANLSTQNTHMCTKKNCAQKILIFAHTILNCA